MSDVAVFEAKNRLSELIARVEAGEVIRITRRGRVVAQLSRPAPHDERQRAQAAVARLLELREGVSLGGLSARGLIEQGRR